MIRDASLESLLFDLCSTIYPFFCFSHTAALAIVAFMRRAVGTGGVAVANGNFKASTVVYVTALPRQKPNAKLSIFRNRHCNG